MSNQPICPLCNGTTIKGETFCRGCQEILKTSDLGKIADVEIDKSDSNVRDWIRADNKEEKTDIQQNEKVSKRRYIIIVGSVALVCIVIVLGCFLHDKNKKREKENLSWAQTVEENTSLGYSNYLLSYPQGLYSNEAETKMRTLKEREVSQWLELQNEDNIDAFQSYLQEYPNTPFVDLINNKIDQFAWEEAENQNTADAYRSYIENVQLKNYRGNYLGLAEEKLVYQSQLKTLEGEDKKIVIEKTQNILESLSKKDFDTFETYLSTTLLGILDIYDLDKNALIDSLKNIDSDKAFSEFKVIAGKTNITKDMYNVFHVSSLVTEESEAKEDERTATDTTYLKMELDSTLKVTTLVLRKKR